MRSISPDPGTSYLVVANPVRRALAVPEVSPLAASGVFTLAVAAMTILLLAPGLVMGSFSDSAVFTVMGREWLDGRIPYRDLFDHKPSVVYMVSALAQWAMGRTWTSLWVTSVVALSGAGLLLFGSYRRLAERNAAMM